jgi:hypothetical protein
MNKQDLLNTFHPDTKVRRTRDAAYTERQSAQRIQQLIQRGFPESFAKQMSDRFRSKKTLDAATANWENKCHLSGVSFTPLPLLSPVHDPVTNTFSTKIVHTMRGDLDPSLFKAVCAQVTAHANKQKHGVRRDDSNVGPRHTPLQPNPRPTTSRSDHQRHVLGLMDS